VSEIYPEFTGISQLCSYVGLIPPAEFGPLLFLRFNLPGAPSGVFGLLSPLFPFRVGGTSVDFESDDGVGETLVVIDSGPLDAPGTISLSFSFLPVDFKWKSPG
jgi:hypothetical protein